MQCDICGRETKVFLTEIEGAKLYVCSECNPSGNGKIVKAKKRYTGFSKKQFIPKFTMRKQVPFDLNNYELVDNFAELIRKTRVASKKTNEEFAKELFVTVSYLQKVEQGKLKPSSSLLLKLYERYGLLLVNKIPGKEVPDFSKPRFKNKAFKKHPFKPKLDNTKKYEKEEKFVGSKEIYSSENSNSDSFKLVEYNNKKKIVL